jgi:DNA helicase II / ATP-dependent DNA helicase PcrA
MSRSYQLHPSPGSGSAIDFAESLNDQQLEAVTSPAGAHLVIAGAGSGKTRTLTYRVAWLLEQGYRPGEILLLTFTNKAAREMLERVNDLLPGASEGLWSGTFHSIGHRILRRHPEAVGFREGFTIMDREDQEELLESVVARMGFRTNDKRFPKGEVLAELISLGCNTGETLRTLLARRYRYFIDLEEQIAQVATAYEGRKKGVNALDFDDLLSKTHELLLTSPEIAATYQRRFRAILVDEYQDTNRLQAGLIDTMAASHKHIMVVGDDAQSIYSWRGADFANILEFPKRYPDSVIHRIETNYRSVPQVLELANASILNNPRQFPKELRAVRKPAVTKPALVPLATNNEQASFIAQRVLELHDEGIDFREIAVLYRAHYHSMEIQLEFTRRGIPFAITSGLRFFEQAHIKDVAAFLKFAINPNDEVAFKRMARLLPGIGSKTAETLWLQSAKLLEGSRLFSRLEKGCKPPSKATGAWSQLIGTLAKLAPMGVPAPPSEMITEVTSGLYDDYMQAKFANYEARRDDLNTLANYAKQFEQTDEFLAQLTLLGGTETSEVTGRDDEEDRVCLSSIHQAKGLEWQAVFLAWLTEGMFPGTRSLEDESALEEERRLFYVGVTRCKEELYLTYPELRLNAGYGEAFQRPSRFLEELPEHLTERWEVARAVARFTPQGDRDKQRHQRRECDPADESQVSEWED